ncbi:YceI family protein [Variovorax soli]|uniref:Polyisoprenoid-binding protein YceI n=1 Tax=Variovorax soli TaxID=376815 RepID=A0ABU1N8Z3_9BURK|nr:polyisoprenoid-binding protein YceI [Variovorax soli]
MSPLHRMWHALCAAALTLASAAAMGGGAEPVAQLAPGQSQIGFVSKQMGVPVEGQFRKFDAQIAFDPKKPEGGTAALQIDMASATLGVPQSDAELPKAPWFDTARFPKASFQSSAIKSLGGGRFDIAGRLTIKGQTQELVVPVTITQSADRSTATGSFTISRLAFKVGEGEWADTSMVGDEVQVRFKLVLTGLRPL